MSCRKQKPEYKGVFTKNKVHVLRWCPGPKKKKKKSGGWRSTAVPEQAVVGNDPGPNEKEKAPQRRLSLIPAIEKASTGCTEHLDKVTEEKPLRVIK